MTRLRAIGLSVWQWVKRVPEQLSAIPESPHKIAKAFAIGVFVGILPGPGAGVALLVSVVWRLSKLATLMGALVTNPWSAPFIYVVSYQLGARLMGLDHPVEWHTVFRFKENWHLELLRGAPPLLFGSIALGASVAVLFYFVVRFTVTQYRTARLARAADRTSAPERSRLSVDPES